MARNNTALSFKGNIINNEFNQCKESTKRDNERKRSANKTNLPA